MDDNGNGDEETTPAPLAVDDVIVSLTCPSVSLNSKSVSSSSCDCGASDCRTPCTAATCCCELLLLLAATIAVAEAAIADLRASPGLCNSIGETFVTCFAGTARDAGMRKLQTEKNEPNLDSLQRVLVANSRLNGRRSMRVA
jgi:hypothetical protein